MPEELLHHLLFFQASCTSWRFGNPRWKQFCRDVCRRPCVAGRTLSSNRWEESPRNRQHCWGVELIKVLLLSEPAKMAGRKFTFRELAASPLPASTLSRWFPCFSGGIWIRFVEDTHLKFNSISNFTIPKKGKWYSLGNESWKGLGVSPLIDPQAMRGSTMMHDPIYDVQTTKRGAAEISSKKRVEGVEKTGWTFKPLTKWPAVIEVTVPESMISSDIPILRCPKNSEEYLLRRIYLNVGIKTKPTTNATHRDRQTLRWGYDPNLYDYRGDMPEVMTDAKLGHVQEMLESIPYLDCCERQQRSFGLFFFLRSGGGFIYLLGRGQFQVGCRGAVDLCLSTFDTV